MSTSVRKVYAHFKDGKFNKVAIFNGIELIQVACSSLPCTLSLYNAFMWTLSVKAGQKRTEARRRNERTNDGTNERTNRSRGLLNYTNRFTCISNNFVIACGHYYNCFYQSTSPIPTQTEAMVKT